MWSNQEMRQTWKILLILFPVTMLPAVFVYNRNFQLDIEAIKIQPYIATSTPNIYFVNTNINDPNINHRTLCSLESASLHNPDSQVIFYSLVKPNATQLPDIHNLRILTTSAEDILSNTPLAEWHQKEEYKNGPFEISHLSDAIRLALLWKNGGIYMDTDVWSIKKVSHLRNSIAPEDDVHLNGAIMMFDKHHPYLYDCMLEFARNYKKFEFIAQGPGLLTRVLRQKCGINHAIRDADSEKIYSCFNINLLSSKAFYPVPYIHWKSVLFSPVKMVYTWNSSYVFHLWNKMSSGSVIKIGEGIFLEELARRNCPMVFMLMSEKGVI